MLYFRGNIKSEELKVCVLLMLGVVLIMADPWSKRIDLSHATVSSKVADAIMLFSSLPAALFFSINKFLMEGRIVRHLIILNATIMIISAILATIYDDASFDRNPQSGLFGWMNSSNWFTSIVVYGGLNTFWGNTGYLLSMHFFSPIVVMNALLLEPFFS